MALDSILKERKSGQDLFAASIPSGEPALVTQTPGYAFGVFKSVSGTVASTITLVDVPTGEALVISDILISSKKKAASSLTIRLTDGTDTVTIFSPDTVQAEVNFGIAFAGLWQGWAGAGIEVVTVADFPFTVAVGYFKLNSTEDFSQWDSRR